MIITLLQLHVVLMVLSLVITSWAVASTVFGRRSSRLILRMNIVLTAIGSSSGVALLLHDPLNPRCLLLAAYLFAFAVAYRYMDTKRPTITTDSI